MAKLFSLVISISVLASVLANAGAQSPTPSPSPFSAPTTAAAPEPAEAAPEPSEAAPGPAASAPMPALDCTNDLMNLSSCLTYVEKGSNLTVPDKGCCPSLSSLVDNNPVCLCQLLSSGGNPLGLEIDTTKALMLPTACKVSTPPVSLCSAVGIPVASPSPFSPAPAIPGTGSGTSSGTISGMPSAAPPAPSSVDSMAKAPTGMATVIIALLFMALF